MAHAYTPGLRVTRSALIRKRRILPIKGTLLVAEGQTVTATDIVARAEIPGRVHAVNIVNKLSIEAGETTRYMKKKAGDEVRKDETIAENNPLIKWFKSAVPSPIDGKVESVSDVTGQVLLREPPKPLNLAAYVDGTVVEVIPGEGVVVETHAAFAQGIFGIGGETVGHLETIVASPDVDLKPGDLRPEHAGKILIGGAHASMPVIRRAIEVKAAAIVIGGIHDKDLREILGKDLGVAITGTENVGITLIITEGFGSIPMAQKTFELLQSLKGRKASCSGATQIRAGVIRPEIVIPTDAPAGAGGKEGEKEGMKPGDPVRIIREPMFGRLGTIQSLPPDLTKIPTESHVRVLVVRFSDGSTATVPRTNVESIES
ncbi:MAG: hypothetical protein HUU15_07180 [Candidatus Brocadiae bacterium]|nr:hypothetical protein [Candidatus Brocadiia bacterium]